MSPPSSLAIATSSLQRLVKEEVSYEKELQVQETRLEKILAAKDDDENADYKLKQERAAIQETKNVFPPLRQRIKDALQKLEDQVEDGQSNGAVESEITKAKEVIQSAREASKD
ncbi:related to beta-tubulin binding protein [Rhynchosporium secalis]|uniref:Tubulin-specific chaperone A n=1 Tax=Rhynchosporium secalis TaxID=38038 RepID=A0A1E1MFI3_RHYSE|nr:related to beta-tubulin binding protein [Rhynchosporium secalis]